MGLVVVDSHFSSADDLEPVALNDEGCSFVDTDSENFWVRIRYVDQFVIPLRFRQVRVNRDIRQKSEAAIMPRRHQKRLLGPATDDERS